MATAVIISNMGGPDSLESVRSYLTNVFGDPAIIDIPLPRFLRPRFARWLAGKRSPKSMEIYEQIGGKTPLTEITQRQADLLEKELNAEGGAAYRVFPAMRYWHPLVEDVWRNVVTNGFDRVVVVSLFPYYSSSTSGSLVGLVEKLNEQNGFDENNFLIVDRYGDHPAFVRAVAENIKDGIGAERLSAGTPVHLMLSAHSVPMRLIKKGDPYQNEIEDSVEAIKKQLPQNVVVHLSYQSKIGPVKWLGPFTSDKIEELAARGVEELYVYPLGHVAENSETLYEIGILFKELALEKGIESYRRIDALNTAPLFISALKEIIIDKSRH